MIIYCNSKFQPTTFSLIWGENGCYDQIDGHNALDLPETPKSALVEYLFSQGFVQKESSGRNGFSIIMTKGNDSAIIVQEVSKLAWDQTKIKEANKGLNLLRNSE